MALGVAYRGAKEHDDARAPPTSGRWGCIRPTRRRSTTSASCTWTSCSDKTRAREHLTQYRKVAPAGDARSKEVFARLRELK